MPVICIGPVCVPLHLLLPFLVALAHQHGYLKWFKRDWVTWTWWLHLFKRAVGKAGDVPVQQQSTAQGPSVPTGGQAANAAGLLDTQVGQKDPDRHKKAS